MSLCLTLIIIRYGSRVKWSNPGKEVAPSSTPWRSSYWKGSLRVTLDYSHQLYLLTLGSWYNHIYQPLRSGRMWHKVNFKRSLTGLNSEFSFSKTSCLNKAEETSLSYYLPIAGGRIIGFIPFPRVLVLCEMQLVSARIWTSVAVSISYHGNHYTTGTS